jgi:hypothetical protein
MPLAMRLGLGLLLLLAISDASAEPVAVRFPESVAHGFLMIRDQRGEVLAHGELLQTLAGEAVQSRLVFRFIDGSLYDETVTFSQKRVFRLLAYTLVQKGPSFPETSEVSFDRASGRYRARTGTEEPVEGTFELPEDLHNGMTGTLIKNLRDGATATGHVYAFTPKPRLLRSALRHEGEDKYFIGNAARTASRYLVTMEIGGLTGVVASVIGKTPPDLRYWTSTGPAPGFLRFEGAMFLKGPTWRIEHAPPRWATER